ncbi:hypothetical protein DFH29DRAFT_1073157 [Suillus ampliporus]|nr:hypothetical protein DFH29DRAFT_1073157 [Suillus ampliporus]
MKMDVSACPLRVVQKFQRRKGGWNLEGLKISAIFTVNQVSYISQQLLNEPFDEVKAQMLTSSVKLRENCCTSVLQFTRMAPLFAPINFINLLDVISDLRETPADSFLARTNELNDIGQHIISPERAIMFISFPFLEKLPLRCFGGAFALMGHCRELSRQLLNKPFNKVKAQMPVQTHCGRPGLPDPRYPPSDTNGPEGVGELVEKQNNSHLSTGGKQWRKFGGNISGNFRQHAVPPTATLGRRDIV